MMFVDDLRTLVVPTIVPAIGYFEGTHASIPTGPSAVGPYLSIVSTGGSGPEYVQNSASPAYKRPTAQVTVHASTVAVAKAKAAEALSILASVSNATVNGTWYRSIRAMQSEPFDSGVDPKARPTYKFNVIGDLGA